MLRLMAKVFEALALLFATRLTTAIAELPAHEPEAEPETETDEVAGVACADGRDYLMLIASGDASGVGFLGSRIEVGQA